MGYNILKRLRRLPLILAEIPGSKTKSELAVYLQQKFLRCVRYRPDSDQAKSLSKFDTVAGFHTEETHPDLHRQLFCSVEHILGSEVLNSEGGGGDFQRNF